MDLSTTKMLSIHIDALLPPTSAELDVPASVMSAALLGLGLVYQGTAHRLMTEVLLSEIGMLVEVGGGILRCGLMIVNDRI